MSWLAGYLHGETVAFATLLYGGVLDEFPNLKICLPHGGGAVPYQFGRFEWAAGVTPGVKSKKSLREYLSNFYFDVVIHDVQARQYLVEFMGADNLVVGSNFPGWDAVNGFEFVEELNLTDGDSEKIVSGNATRLFKLT
jgi:aminocarboxymuconate-semialdehyde decarboxylase